jgi:hypothetical protein
MYGEAFEAHIKAALCGLWDTGAAGNIRLTYHDTIGRDGPAAAESVEAGAPDEIEITLEMYEAGRAAYDKWFASSCGDTGPLSEMFAAVFLAMTQARYIRVLSTPPLILTKDHRGHSLSVLKCLS